MSASDSDISERARHLMKVLVERYIRDGMPVGSRTLSRDSGLDLSAATIRNVMADLEDLGFLGSPHTSAGRIPTPKGYRFFVDTLVSYREPSTRDVERLAGQLDSDTHTEDQLYQTASRALSSLTQLAGVVTVPRRSEEELQQIEFLPLSERRVLAIVVLNDRAVQNRILHVDRDYDREELHRAANFLTEQFAGKSVRDVRKEILESLADTRESMNQLMMDAIHIAQRMFEKEGAEGGGYVLAGETNLMGFNEMADLDRLRQLFDAFGQQRDILHLLDRCLSAETAQIFIGEESGYQILDGCSVVAAPYVVNDEVVGVLGVIGPTRMAYERVVPIVDVTARLLGTALKTRD